MEMRDKRGVENIVADHLSHLERKKEIEEPKDIKEFFPNEQ